MPRTSATALLSTVLLLLVGLAGCTGDADEGGPSATGTTTAAKGPPAGCVDAVADLCPVDGVDCAVSGDEGACDRAFEAATCSLPDANENGMCDESRLCQELRNRNLPLCEVPDCNLDTAPASAADLDGDLLEDNMERALLDHGFVLRLCDPDSDGDGTIDGRDLSWRTASLAGVVQDRLGDVNRTGIQVRLWFEDYYQYNQGILDDPDCTREIDEGGYLDEPGDGDLWLSDISFIGTGNLVPGAGGGKPVAFRGFLHDDHSWDEECMTDMHRPMLDGAAVLPEDVKDWLRNPSTKVFPAALGAPSIAALLLVMDDDGGCEHEYYLVFEPDAQTCSGDAPIPDLQIDFITLVLALTAAPGVPGTVQQMAEASTGVIEDLCLVEYGLYLCFSLQVTDAQGRPLDWCNVGLVAEAWTANFGAVVDRLLTGDCLKVG